MSGTIQPTASQGIATTAPSAAASTGSFGSDFQTFLTLLTTQLQNQDPTNAMSPEQMTAQLVQFAGVEQQILANDNLRTLIDLQSAAQLTASAPLLGRVVEVESDRLSLQDGEATLRLPAAGAAREALVRVLDTAGAVLREDRVPLGAAPQDWRWDGRDSRGEQRPDGAYAFAAIGLDAEGAARPLEATVRGLATGAERRGGEVSLALGGLAVGFDKLRSLPSAE